MHVAVTPISRGSRASVRIPATIDALDMLGPRSASRYAKTAISVVTSVMTAAYRNAAR